ncbi:alpha/beta fold hydrolase [Paenibacillus nasutitermitis]|uniref:Alpha/beta hydrolase n=1 Tax=Paenibacillus nasutitermitis TaxID=1652958 RepID=A0A916YPC8_9BACL|nr:alpha/beta fold hydrolase [Paenibacillus nasutitermitis]GGD52931.1 alpha/beta hydrolase [Paenibacillus nasutitermitis]
MSKVISKDGTSIEFDRTGEGPPIILVVGAFNDRSTGAHLAKLLESNFTVINYDRRGKGASGDTLPYAIEREIEDLEALIDVAGGSACVFGYSSGANLALKAAVKGAAISKLVLYEAPVEGHDNNLVNQLSELISAGRRGDAVEFFQSKLVGLPDDVVTQLRNAPFRPYLEALAHTTVYDTRLVCEPPLREELVGISTPVLVVTGEESKDSFKQSNELLATDLPNGQYICLEGQNHHLEAPVLAPVVKKFLLS